MKKTIAIVFGGDSCEHDVSVITALHAYNAYRNRYAERILVYMRGGKFYVGGKLKEITCYKNFSEYGLDEVFFSCGKIMHTKKRLKGARTIDCAILCNHGGEGENGCLQGYFEVARIPYSSAKPAASAICMDKILTKRLLMAGGFDFVPYAEVNDGERDLSFVERLGGYPLIVKPSRQGSSIGIAKVCTEKELITALETAEEYDSRILVEKCLLDYTELNCACLRNESELLTGTVEKVYAKAGYLSFADKYLEGDAKVNERREIPAKVSAEAAGKIKQLTKKLYDYFQLDGVVRIDYLLSDNIVYVNEINTVPGSLAYYLFVRQGIDYGSLLNLLADNAVLRMKNETAYRKSFASDVLTHYESESITSIKK